MVGPAVMLGASNERMEESPWLLLESIQILDLLFLCYFFPINNPFLL
jgi:hypothetical protein